MSEIAFSVFDVTKHPICYVKYSHVKACVIATCREGLNFLSEGYELWSKRQNN